MARKLTIVAGAVLASVVLVPLAQRDRFTPYWADAKAAWSWDNPLCTRFAAFRGLVKARTVTARIDEIMHTLRYVGEDPEGVFLYQTPEGDVWMPQRDDLWSLAVVLAEQEQEMYGHPGDLGVHQGDVVSDAGARVGLFTRTALAAGASKVIASK
jgi:hypothetical protein